MQHSIGSCSGSWTHWHRDRIAGMLLFFAFKLTNTYINWPHWLKVHLDYIRNRDLLFAREWMKQWLVLARRQAIIWSHEIPLWLGPSGTKFSEIHIEIKTFSLTKLHLKIASAEVAAILSLPQYVKGIKPNPTTAKHEHNDILECMLYNRAL